MIPLQLVIDISSEMESATAKFPKWPSDPIHAASIIAEEAGELVKEVNQLSYEPHKSSIEAVRKEAIQIAATALRFLMSIERYQFTPSAQHIQGVAPKAEAHFALLPTWQAHNPATGDSNC